MDYSDTTVIVPTLNEEKNIGKLIDLVRKNAPGAYVIVSDDGSKDKTKAIVESKKAYFLDRSREKVKGLTASVNDGVKKAKTKFMVVIDGDLQHPPEKIPEIVRKLREGFDVVVGTREKVASEWAFHRKIMSKTAIVMGQLRLLLKGIWVRDVVSGFFGARTELFKDALRRAEGKFEPRGYKVLFDFLKQLKKPKIGEVYYVFGLRKGGTSKISKTHIWLYFKSMFK